MNGRLQDKLDELHLACTKIKASIAHEAAGNEAGGISAVSSDLESLYQHLCAITEVLLKRKISNSLQFDFINHDEIKERAHDIIVENFFSRKGSDSTYRIFNVIENLFRHNPSPDPLDTFRFFKKVLSISISNFSRNVIMERNPLFLSTSKKLDYYIKNSTRYTLYNSIVIDSFVEKEIPAAFPTAEDLINITSSMPIPTNVAKATDSFFNALLDTTLFRNSVNLVELRKATYKALEHRLIDGELSFLSKGMDSPEHTLIKGVMNAARKEALVEIKTSYEKNKNYEPEILYAFLNAGNDYLYDYEVKSKIDSLSKYLSMYLGGCTPEEYERKYKGKFQHFIKKLFELWRKKLHENPIVSLHIKDVAGGRTR